MGSAAVCGRRGAWRRGFAAGLSRIGPGVGGLGPRSPWRPPSRLLILRGNVTNDYPKMTALARTFPTLDRAGGVEPFNAVRLDAWAYGPEPSHGAQHAARFLLAVYVGRAFNRVVDHRPQDDRATFLFTIDAAWNCAPFDVVNAMGTWDAAHRAAFVAWASDPWWP